ncbi:unnamed protein product [Spirodela intermedia]|uniref:Uncharacterized protein n=1 Tax=Spirodela intermedia TaxID=51605 RepID=A0A7I8JZ34_SPIIN|nr:unnamed protein product [Spirodela intermedia]
MEDCLPGGTIFFTTVGVQLYGFDVFSVPVGAAAGDRPPETRHTDGVSVNFNGQFLEDDDHLAVAFVSERSGSARPFLARMGRPEPLPHFPESLRHDRPVVRNGFVYLVSAHERPAGGGVAAAGGDSVVPNLSPVVSPATGLKMARKPAAFYTSWNPAERGVIYTSVGPIFQGPEVTVQIARVSFDPASLHQVAVGDLVPSELKILTRTDAGNNAFPSCSPDGKWINLYIMDATKGETGGGEIRRLTDGDWIDTMPCWSPDGELIAFSSNCHSPKDPEVFGLYLVRPDGEGLRRVPVAGPEGSEESRRERINHICFSPDSKWLLFTSNIAGVVAEPVGLPNHGLRRLTCNSYENGTPTWVEEREDLAVHVGGLSLGGVASGDKLRGQFVEPLWLNCEL